MKLLLIIPPMTQVNTPYPATAYLTQYLRDQGYQSIGKIRAIITKRNRSNPPPFLKKEGLSGRLLDDSFGFSYEILIYERSLS